MNGRIKQLRNALDLSQKEFGDSIGLKSNSVSYIESGKNAVTEQNIKMICSIFHVNEEWLRSGIGEMFIEFNDDAFKQLKTEYDLSDLETILLEEYLKLSKLQRESVMSYFGSVFGKLSTKEPAPVNDTELALTAEQAYEKNFLNAPRRGSTASNIIKDTERKNA